MKILIGTALFFSAFIALSYIVGRLFTTLIIGRPQKQNNEKCEYKNESQETIKKVNYATINTSTKNIIKSGGTAIKKAKKTVAEKVVIQTNIQTSDTAQGRFDNRIIQLHNAEIRYPNTVHSSFDKCLTTLGIFDDPIFIEHDGEVVPCGHFRDALSDGSDSFYFRCPDKDILIRNYDKKCYYTRFFAYSINEGKYVNIHQNSDTVFRYDKYNNFIAEMYVDGDYFYYLDERSDFCLQKCSLPKDMHPANAHISDDGSRFLFGKYGQSDTYMFDISSGKIKAMPKVSYNTFIIPSCQPDYPQYYHFYYSADNSKASQIMNKYLRMHPELEYRIIANEFEDDSAVNIDVKIPRDNKEAMALCDYLDQSINKYIIYGFNPSTIVDLAGETYRYYMYLYSKVSTEEKNECNEIKEKIKNKYGYNDNKALDYIYNKYCAYEKKSRINGS